MNKTAIYAILLIALAALTACKDTKSYAELLTDEAHAVNYFLANQRVVNQVPADSVFETGPDAPYYRLDEDGNLYMQVINPGTPDNRVEDDELIYFRYTRYNLQTYHATDEMIGEGNAITLTMGPASFRYGNTRLSSTTQFGQGVQWPLRYLGIDCEVNIVIKSQYGFTSEIAQVTPYMYNLRYFKSPI